MSQDLNPNPRKPTCSSSHIAMGSFWGLSPPNKTPSPPTWNMKHCKLVEILLNLNVNPPLHERKAPPHKCKAPYWRLSGDGSVFISGLFHVLAMRKTRKYISCFAIEKLERQVRKASHCAASNNRDNMPWSLYYCLFAPRIYECYSLGTSRSWRITHSTQR